MEQKKLIAIRKRKGLVQKDMAEMMDMSVTTYWAKEKGHRAFNLDQWMHLARILKKPIAEIRT